MCTSSSVVATLFVQLLRMLGIKTIAVDKRILYSMPVACRRFSEGILHYIAVSLILGKVRVCFDRVSGGLLGFYKGVTLLSLTKRGYTTSDAVVLRRSASCVNVDITDSLANQLTYLLPKTPMFIIDLSLWELHHEREITSLIKQLVVTISTIRRWLTDLNIAFVSVPGEVIQRLQDIIPNVSAYHGTPDIYKMIEPNQAVLLDPYASDTLSEDDIRKHNYFIIGGIIDRMYPRPFATYMIHRMHELDIARKVIKLRGSTIGVPSELNKIVDIILWVRLGGITLDEAIIMNMSKDDKIMRVIYDIEKGIRAGRSIHIKDLEDIAKIYYLDRESMKRVLSNINRLKLN